MEAIIIKILRSKAYYWIAKDHTTNIKMESLPFLKEFQVTNMRSIGFVVWLKEYSESTEDISKK